MATLPTIKDAIINSCLEFQPNHLKAHLLSDYLKVDSTDKNEFFKYFKFMIANSRKISTGKLYFEVTHPDSKDKNWMHYDFFDDVHLHPRLSLEIRESNGCLHLDINPF